MPDYDHNQRAENSQSDQLIKAALLLFGGIVLWSATQSDAAENDIHARKQGDTIEAVTARWDRMSKHWTSFSSTSTLTAHILINQLRLAEASSVLEVGCGLGDGSNLAAQYLRQGAQMVCTDISPEMISGAKARFARAPQITFQVANAEQLPFQDAQFDRYLANFVLHLTPDPQQMAREAARVLQPGGVAAFSVWGRPGAETSLQAHLIPDAAKAVGIRVPPPTWRSPAHLGVNADETRKLLLDAGFSRVIAWYINQPLACTTGECVVDTLMHSTQGDFVNSLSPAQKATWRAKAVEIGNACYSNGKPVGFEVLVLIAVK